MASTSKNQQVSYERKWELGLKFEGGVLSGSMMRAAAAEFLGMMLFLFSVITIAVRTQQEEGTEVSNDYIPDAVTKIAFGFGLAIFVLVYILAEVSGANLNPAVSIGLVIGKRIGVDRFVIYVIAQVLGAIAGAAIAQTFRNDKDFLGVNALGTDVEAEEAFGGEVLCTFLLVLTVYAATDGEMTRKHGHIPALLPYAIGMAVLLAHLVMIPIDGCSINPARSFATSVTEDHWDDHWVFWIGPLVGGALAPIVWEAILRPEQMVSPLSSSGGTVAVSSV